jgi:hypothetical protein
VGDVSPSAPVEPEVAVAAQYAAAAETLVRAEPAVIPVAAPVAPAPLPVFRPARLAQLDPAPRASRNGRFVVQIGAYKNQVQVELAWSRAQERYGFGADKQPVSTTVKLPGRAMLHRLSVASFEAPAQAARVCQSIRARGGACFVRTRAGDAPVQWASRYTARG